MKAWYFSKEDRRLRYDDGREIAVGVTHEIDGTPELCERGLHGSMCAMDALSYAPGPIVWRVELSGEMDKGDDKIAATKREYIAGGIDVSDVLREYARWCALQVCHLWDAPDVVKQYLKTGNEKIRAAARDAARDAAGAAARAAARDAAGDAAWYAARAAAGYAARAAARDAAGDAAGAAARAAAGDAAWYAAGYVAWDAARDAATKKQNAKLTRMLNKAIKEAHNV